MEVWLFQKEKNRKQIYPTLVKSLFENTMGNPFLIKFLKKKKLPEIFLSLCGSLLEAQIKQCPLTRPL